MDIAILKAQQAEVPGGNTGSGFLSQFLHRIRDLPAECNGQLEKIRELDQTAQELALECEEMEKSLGAVSQNRFMHCRFARLITLPSPMRRVAAQSPSPSILSAAALPGTCRS